MSTGPSGIDGGMILYVMRTFLAFRHMGSVECVTDQVPSSHSGDGALKLVVDGSFGLYFRGDRRVVGGLTVARDGRAPGGGLRGVVDASWVAANSGGIMVVELAIADV